MFSTVPYMGHWSRMGTGFLSFTIYKIPHFSFIMEVLCPAYWAYVNYTKRNHCIAPFSNLMWDHNRQGFVYIGDVDLGYFIIFWANS